MARRAPYRNFRSPVAVAATRALPGTHRLAATGLALATAIALLIHPLAGLAVVGVGLWQALSPE